MSWIAGRGFPYDNAIAVATFKIIKTEFVKRCRFISLEELTRETKECSQLKRNQDWLCGRQKLL
nr:hypothetical protein [Bacillus sp. OV322]